MTTDSKLPSPAGPTPVELDFCTGCKCYCGPFDQLDTSTGEGNRCPKCKTRTLLHRVTLYAPAAQAEETGDDEPIRHSRFPARFDKTLVCSDFGAIVNGVAPLQDGWELLEYRDRYVYRPVAAPAPDAGTGEDAECEWPTEPGEWEHARLRGEFSNDGAGNIVLYRVWKAVGLDGQGFWGHPGDSHHALRGWRRIAPADADLRAEVAGLRSKLLCGHPRLAWGKVNKADPNEAEHCLWCGDIADMRTLVHHLSLTYDHFSAGQVSKPMTKPEVVFKINAELEDIRWEECLKEHREEDAATIERLTAELAKRDERWAELRQWTYESHQHALEIRNMGAENAYSRMRTKMSALELAAPPAAADGSTRE
jgi:hypothetical protein